MLQTGASSCPVFVGCVVLSIAQSQVSKFLTPLFGCSCPLASGLPSLGLPLEGEWRVLARTTSKVSGLLVLFSWSSLLPGFLPLKGERISVRRAATKLPHSDG